MPSDGLARESGQLLRSGRTSEFVQLLEERATVGEVDLVGDYACELSMMRVEGADRLFAKAIALAPDDPRHRLNLGIHLRSVKRLPDAIASFQSAVQLAVEWDEALLQLGNAEHAGGDLSQARLAIAAAVRANPRNFYALHALGAIDLHQGFLEEADEHLRLAIAAEPRYPLPYRTLADVATARGHKEETARWNAEAMKRAPNAGDFKAATFVMSDDPRRERIRGGAGPKVRGS